MTIHFIHEMDRLHRDILSMCSTVEEMIQDVLDCLKPGRTGLAAEIVLRDREVNEWDIRVEEECLKILALYHPVANDLRRVTVVLKIAQELERVGDLSVNIAERSQALAELGQFPLPDRLEEMAVASLSMLRDSIDAFVAQDSEKARDVCQRDDDVDQLNVELINEVVDAMKQDVDRVAPGIHVFSIIRHIERVADHATNIAEDVVYMVVGEIIRHPRLRRSEGETTR